MIMRCMNACFYHRSGNQQKGAPTPAASQKAETAAKADGTPEPLPVSVAAAEGTGTSHFCLDEIGPLWLAHP